MKNQPTSDVTQPQPLPHTIFDLPSDWEDAPKIIVTCPFCEKDHYHNELLAQVFPHTLCDPCVDRQNAQLGAKAYHDPIQTKQALVDACMPSLYQDTDPTLVPHNQLETITSWKFNPIGLWITGDTRTFKTRSLCILLKYLIAKRQVISFFHGEFHDQLLDVFSSEQSLSRFKANLTSIPILAIDDLFASRLTERAETTLFEIFDARIANQLPTLVTTQVTKREALRIFASPKRHEAFFARIKEFFTVINTNAYAKQHKLHLSQ